MVGRKEKQNELNYWQNTHRLSEHARHIQWSLYKVTLYFVHEYFFILLVTPPCLSLPVLFTSDEGVGICFRPHARVRLSVCVQDYSKTRTWIWMKCCRSTDVGTWTNWLTFEPDRDYSPDAGTGLLSAISFQRCYAEFYVGKMRRIRRPIGRYSEECF